MFKKRKKAQPYQEDWIAPGEVVEIGKDLAGAAKRTDLTTRAAAVAYHLIFAIPPLLTLLMLIAALLNRVTDLEIVERLRTAIAEHAPAETQDLLNSIVDNAIAEVGGGGLSFGIVLTAALALWSGANATGAMMAAFNNAYEVEEERPFVRRRLITLGLTLGIVLGINVAFALLVFGERIGSWLADQIGAGRIFDIVWNLGRWPLAILGIVLLLSALYRFGPCLELPWHWITPGSLLATGLWLIATLGFGLFLRVSNPGSAYGAVGSLLVLLFFLYATGMIFILGATLNAVMAGRETSAES